MCSHLVARAALAAPSAMAASGPWLTASQGLGGPGSCGGECRVVIQLDDMDDRLSAVAMTRCHAGFSRILSRAPTSPATISVASSSERVSSCASSLSLASKWRASSALTDASGTSNRTPRTPGQSRHLRSAAPRGGAGRTGRPRRPRRLPARARKARRLSAFPPFRSTRCDQVEQERPSPLVRRAGRRPTNPP
jgi:hypothetical protein